MSLNFNVGPYFDDFDPSKNFHRILFKPGFAVQARELTQSQTILQNQISNFASSIFTQNTPISGGQVTLNQNCYYIKLNATDVNGATVLASNFLNQIIQDVTGTVQARVIAGAEASGDPTTLIVTYLSGAMFADGYTLYSTNSQQVFTAVVANSTTTTIDGVTTENKSTGLSSTASVADGVFYIVNGYSISQATGVQYSIGNFVQVNAQTIILDKYDNVPSFRVGLQINETIYDYVDDVSLLDPAIGASNYQAPGADRYVINLTLISLPLGIGQDQSFIELVRIENGNVVKQVDGTVYSTIDEYFAKRDYETNGDYIVYDFTLTPSANANTAINTSNYNLGISKGVAYVHGYRVENQSQLTLTNARSQQTANIASNSVQPNYGNYFVVDTVNNVFDVTTMPVVDLHCVAPAYIATSNITTYSSTLVGRAFIRNLSYVSGSGTTTSSYVYNAHIANLLTTSLSGTVSGGTANTITIVDTTGKFSGVANAYYNATVRVTTNGVTATKNIINYTNSPKVITVDSNFSVTPTSSSVFTILFEQGDIESIIKNANNTIGTTGSGTYATTSSLNINTASGKVGGISTGDTILNMPGDVELIFSLGYPYVAEVTNSAYYSTRAFRNKTFSASGQLQLSAGENYSSGFTRFTTSGVLSSGTALSDFIVINTLTGNVLDFSTSGNTITVSPDHTTANLYSAVYANMPVEVIAAVQVLMPSGTDSSPVLKAKNLVTGNTTTISSTLTQVASTGVYLDLTKAQVLVPKSSLSGTNDVSIYVNDVKSVYAIIDLGTTTVSPSGQVSNFNNITNYFKVKNGQKDSHYDHASISLLPGAPLPSGNILVIFNYYSHLGATGDGFFSIESYANAGSSVFGGGVGVSTSPESFAQIPTYTSTNGEVYKLGDSLDFRPCRVNGQTEYIWEYSQTQAATNNIGTLIPQDGQYYTSDYYYYLARNDLLVLTKDKSFQIIQGTPSINPLLPSAPAGSLIIANLMHDPYTAYVPGEAPPRIKSNLSVNKIIHKRWSKSDITVLESRVNNLEYYTALSLLESKAQSQQVPDALGVNRPNYGILVDDFSSFSAADTTDADYQANINVRLNTMTALQFIDNFQLQNPVVLKSMGTVANTGSYAINSISGTQTNIFTLPYTTANVVVQPLASSSIAVNPFSVPIQQGVVQLNPPMDNWIDTNQSPTFLVTDPTVQMYQENGGVNIALAGDAQSLIGVSNIVTNADKSTLTFFGAAYASQTTTTSLSQSSSLTLTNNYLTNTSALPYIRPQQIIVRASGLLVNTPISVSFDGVDVGLLMTNPNTIELTGVSGTFNPDDVVGFYLSSTSPYFFPVARVISTYTYPDTTKVRLCVADVLVNTLTYASTKLQNAVYDQDGNYSTTTASGNVSSGIISIAGSGLIGGIGNTYTSTANTAILGNLIISPMNGNYSAFLNKYGVWGDSYASSTYSSSFPFTAGTAGTYTFQAGADNNAAIYIDGVQLFTIPLSGPVGPSGSNAGENYNSVTTYSATLTAGIHTVSWNAYNLAGPASFALAILNPYNNVVFDTRSPTTISYNNVTSTESLPDGGTFVTGATTAILSPNSSSVDNAYTGGLISFTSNYTVNKLITASYVPPETGTSGVGSFTGGLNLQVGGFGGGSILYTAGSNLGTVAPFVVQETYSLDKAPTTNTGLLVDLPTVVPSYQPGLSVSNQDIYTPQNAFTIPPLYGAYTVFPAAGGGQINPNSALWAGSDDGTGGGGPGRGC